MRPVWIANETNGSVVCDRARVASTFFSRLAGLLGRRSFEPGEGLLIKPSQAIHTLGMSFPIDAIALDRHLRVLELRPGLTPVRIAVFPWKTHSVLELPAGQIGRAGICVEDRLSVASFPPMASP